MTGLLFRLYVKLFLPSFFNSVDIWSKISCLVLDIEPADEDYNKELGVYFNGNVNGYSFRPKMYNSTKQVVWFTKKLQGSVWNSWNLQYRELLKIVPGNVKSEYFAKRAAKCKILAILMDGDLEDLDDHGCPKVRALVDPEKWICSSYPFRHKTTLHCPESREKLFGNWIMHHLKL